MTYNPNDPIATILAGFDARIAAAENPTPAPTPTPAPSFTTQPSVSPTSGTAGSTTFTATPGTVIDGNITSRAWLLNGTSISTGLTASPMAAGMLTYQEMATGESGTAQSVVISTSVAAQPPVFTAQPTVSPASGTVGQVFTSTSGTASNATGYTGQWLLNGTAIAGATALTYTSTMAGSLAYRSTATGPGGTTSVTSSNVTVSAAVGVPAMTFSNASASISEGDTGTKTVSNTINVDRQGVTGPLTINLTYSGTATSGTDYVAGPVSLTLADGVSSGSFDLTINADTTVESDETIIINAALAGYSATASKTITITNDDVAANIFAGPANSRVLITSDFRGGDKDDDQMLVFALLNQHRMRIEGFVVHDLATNAGTAFADTLKNDLIGTAYAADYPYLSANYTGYATPAALQAMVKQGTLGLWTNSTTPSAANEGSAFIIERARAGSVADPLYITAAGGVQDIVRALIDAPDIMDKVILNVIALQDANASEYLRAKIQDGARPWRNLTVIQDNTTFRGVYKNSSGTTGANASAANTAFAPLYARGYGALGDYLDLYCSVAKPPTTEVYLKFGDYPTLLYPLDRFAGRRTLPTQDGWGGRFQLDTAIGDRYYKDSTDTADRLGTAYPGGKTIQQFQDLILADCADVLKRTVAVPRVILNIAATSASANEVVPSRTFTVSRSADSNTGQPVAVNWAVTGSGANPADAADFGGTFPSGTVSLGVGVLSAVITVTSVDDSTVEPDETFTVTISNPTNGATIGTATATGTLVNDDSATPGGQTTYTSDDFQSVTADGNLPGRTASGGGTWVNYRTDRTPLVKVATKDATGISTTGLAYINVSPPTTDYEVEEDVLHVTIGLGAGPIINMNGSQAGGNGTFYSFFYDSTNGWTIGKDANSGASNPPNNTISPAASGVPAPTAGQTKKLKLRRVTSGGVATLTGYVDGVLTHTVTDSTPIASPGFPGSRFISTTRIDNYVARSNPA